MLTLVVLLCNYIILTIAVAFQEMLCVEYVVRSISHHTLHEQSVVVVTNQRSTLLRPFSLLITMNS